MDPISYLCKLNWIAVVLHACVAFLVLLLALATPQASDEWSADVMAFSGDVPPEWQGPGDQLPTTSTGIRLYLPGLLLLFVGGTIAAHAFYAVSPRYRQWMSEGHNPARWVEYGITASVMLVLLQVMCGIREWSTLLVVFVACALLMWQGGVVESMLRVDPQNKWMLHGTGFMAWWLMVAFIIFTYNYFLKQLHAANEKNKADGEESIPGFVKYVLLVTFVFFISFGVVQGVQVWHGHASTQLQQYAKYETAYIALSFSAKACLALWTAIGLYQQGRTVDEPTTS